MTTYDAAELKREPPAQRLAGTDPSDVIDSQHPVVVTGESDPQPA